MQKLKLDFRIIDGLRGLAALYVVINHCRGNLLMGGTEFSQIVPMTEWTFSTKIYFALLQATSLGTEFVILFFVLSGFSIAHSLNNKKSVSQFYLRRVIRLYIPYLLALFWAFIVYNIISSNELIMLKLKGSVFESLNYILFNLVYMPHGDLIPQFWSLTYEVIFYILAPLILFNKKLTNIFTFVLGIFYVIGLFGNYFIDLHESILLKFIFRYGFYFIVGILIYRNYAKFKLFDFITSKRILIISSLILFFAMVTIKYKLGENNVFTPLLSAISSVILLMNFLKFNIKYKLLTAIGNMSYTLYITHFATIYLTLFFFEKFFLNEGQALQTWYVWIVGIFVCILISIPLYLIGEKPTKKILKNLRKDSV